MGNAWFGKKRGMVHPLNHHHALALSGAGKAGSVRLKVRMSRGQLKELMARVNMSKGSLQQLGELILEECFNGTLKARIVVAEEGSDHSHFRPSSALSPIQHHSQD